MKHLFSGFRAAALWVLVCANVSGDPYSIHIWETDSDRIKRTGDLTGTKEKLMKSTLDFREKVALVEGNEHEYRYLDVIPYDSVDSLKSSIVTNLVGKQTARSAPLFRDNAGGGTQAWIQIGYKYKDQPVIKQILVPKETRERLIREIEKRCGQRFVEYIEGIRRPEGGQVFSGITVYPGTGLTSLKRSSDWYAAAILTDASVTLTSREDKNDSMMEIPYSSILSLAYERSASATAWPLRVNRAGMAASFVTNSSQLPPEDWFYIEYDEDGITSRVLLHLQRAIASRFRSAIRRASGISLDNITGN